MEIAVDLVLSVLLLVSIGFSALLSRALKRVRSDRVELSKLIEGLAQSSTRANEGIEHLRQTAEIVGRQLGKTVEQARLQRSELVSLLERADHTALRLERDPVQVSRTVDEPMRDRAIGSQSLVADRTMGKSAAERELIRALRLKQG